MEKPEGKLTEISGIIFIKYSDLPVPKRGTILEFLEQYLYIIRPHNNNI